MPRLRRHIKSLLIRLLEPLILRLGYRAPLPFLLTYTDDGLLTAHNESFRRDPAFRAACARGIAASDGFDPKIEWRLHTVLWAARSALRVEGDFVECGVNAGFMSSAVMHALNWNSTGRNFYLIDTFSGPVLNQYSEDEVRTGRREIAEHNIAEGGYVTDLTRIRANYAEWPRAIVTPGAVPEVLQSIDFGKVAFLHIDMNCALPEKAALEFFWPRLSPGALIVLDDYAYTGYQAQYESMNATARALGCEILSLPTGQGLLIR